MIFSNLIEVVVMDEDDVLLNRDLMGKKSEQISPSGFEGSDIGFKVGVGNEQGNKNKSKGRPKRSGNQETSVSHFCIAQKRLRLWRSLQLEARKQ